MKKEIQPEWREGEMRCRVPRDGCPAFKNNQSLYWCRANDAMLSKNACTPWYRYRVEELQNQLDEALAEVERLKEEVSEYKLQYALIGTDQKTYNER